MENVTKKPAQSLAPKWEKISPIIIQECIDRKLDADQLQILKSLGLENINVAKSMPEGIVYYDWVEQQFCGWHLPCS